MSDVSKNSLVHQQKQHRHNTPPSPHNNRTMIFAALEETFRFWMHLSKKMLANQDRNNKSATPMGMSIVAKYLSL
jgi:hypothetical protein